MDIRGPGISAFCARQGILGVTYLRLYLRKRGANDETNFVKCSPKHLVAVRSGLMPSSSAEPPFPKLSHPSFLWRKALEVAIKWPMSFAKRGHVSKVIFSHLQLTFNKTSSPLVTEAIHGEGEKTELEGAFGII